MAGFPVSFGVVPLETFRRIRVAFARVACIIYLVVNDYTAPRGQGLGQKMNKIATGFTAAAELDFKNWIEEVGKPGIDAEACLSEAAGKLGELDDPAKYGHHYELGRFYTASKNPETYRFSVSEIVFTDFDEDGNEIV